MEALLSSRTLDVLVTKFDTNPGDCRRLIRQMIDEDREGFYRCTVTALASEADSRGAQFLVAMLVSQDFLLRALTDPALNREQVASIVRAAIRGDSVADVKLARQLAESFEPGGVAVSPPHVVRLLDILNEVSTGARLLPAMVRLLRHPDPYLRSKAALLVGRANRSGRWGSDRQSDTDPRIRANAIEGLWGVESTAARELLQSAAGDNHNRVAGNAILGLYQLGDIAAIAKVLEMAEHLSPVFRTTAAWVMGQTADPRFKDALVALVRDPSELVRRRAFAALRRLKAAAPSGEGSTWSVCGRVAPGEPQKSIRKILIAVASESLVPPAVLPPTSFAVWEDGKLVVDYGVTERAPAESLATIFLFPQAGEEDPCGWTAGALTAAAWRRSSDCWAAMHYLPESAGPWDAAQVVEPFRLQSTPNGAIAEVTAKPSKAMCSDLWRVLWRAIKADCGPFRGRRNLIVFVQTPIAGSPAPEILSEIAAHGSLQVIATAPGENLEQLCAGANGQLYKAASVEEAASLIALAGLRLMARYEITYLPLAPEAAEARVRVFNRTAAGETLIKLSSPSPGGS